MQRSITKSIGRLVALGIALTLAISACADKPKDVDIDVLAAQPTQLDSQGAHQVASTFLDAWRGKDYQTMYGLLSPNARDAFSQERFISIYQSVDNNLLNIRRINWTINNVLVQGTTAVIDYGVTFDTELMGTFTDPASADPLGDGLEPRLMRLITTPEGWRVAWSRNDIFSGWDNDVTINPERTIPTRGNIYDRNGQILVDQNGVSIQLYVVKQRMTTIEDCIVLLSDVLRRDENLIRDDFEPRGSDLLFLAGEISQDSMNQYGDQLDSICHVDVRPRTTRQYYDHVAPHLIGYVGQIPVNRQAEFEQKGYPADARVGLDGVEEAFEAELAGKIGVRLVLRSVSGNLIRVVAERPSEPGQSVYLTIDRDFQLALQFLLADAYSEGKVWANRSPGAAAIVMDIHTGEILAMASYPDFDQSIFDPDTQIPDAELLIEEYRTNPNRPLFNRVTQAQLPLGSVFKIFSMVAGLDSGAWTEFSTVHCTGAWPGSIYGDITRYDWLAGGHGSLNMRQGLTASCNPYFWTLSAALNNADTEILPSYARRFGFDSAPPLQGIPTDKGFIIGPNEIVAQRGVEWSQAEASNMVIGQSVVGVSPLQVVRAVAAVANGGTLYRPLVVQKIQLIGQEPSREFFPEGVPMGIDPDVLALTRAAMCDVTTNQTIGTATYIFGDWFRKIDESLYVCGKTGTAQSGQTYPHAWFASFAPADNPRIATVVVVQNSCEGSEVSAPITRRIMEEYFDLGDYFDNGQTFGWPDFWYSGCIALTPNSAGP